MKTSIEDKSNNIVKFIRENEGIIVSAGKIQEVIQEFSEKIEDLNSSLKEGKEYAIVCVTPKGLHIGLAGDEKTLKDYEKLIKNEL